MKLHASGEDYLEAILVLQKKRGLVRSVDVARHMEVTKPSVCHAVATLKEGGFLTMDEDHFLHLTDVGREVAEKIYERHCFFTTQLIAAGVDPSKDLLLFGCKTFCCFIFSSKQYYVELVHITVRLPFDSTGYMQPVYLVRWLDIFHRTSSGFLPGRDEGGTICRWIIIPFRFKVKRSCCFSIISPPGLLAGWAGGLWRKPSGN